MHWFDTVASKRSKQYNIISKIVEVNAWGEVEPIEETKNQLNLINMYE